MRNSAVNILVSSHILKLVNVISFKIVLKIIMNNLIENKGESQKMKVSSANKSKKLLKSGNEKRNIKTKKNKHLIIEKVKPAIPSNEFVLSFF